MEAEGARIWSPITSAEVRATALAFHQIHTERGKSALGCWRERCKDLRPYATDKGEDSWPAA